MTDKTRVIVPVDRQIVQEMIDARLEQIITELNAWWNDQRYDEALTADLLRIILQRAMSK